jgi:hypothetical protein
VSSFSFLASISFLMIRTMSLSGTSMTLSNTMGSRA